MTKNSIKVSKIRSDSNNLQVLYEDNHLIVINKRPGDIVQGDRTGDIPLSEVVKGYIKKKYNKPGNVYLGVVHRLDRPTSGIVVFARTSKALPRLNKMFGLWIKNQPTILKRLIILVFKVLQPMSLIFRLKD